MANSAHPTFDAFIATVAKLRDPHEGCPWNRAQTHASIGDCMIEEAYEALDAIQADDAVHLREELGDVLLQVVLQSQIAAEAGEFTIDDVCADIDAKMIRRHPHVFAGVKVTDANDVSALWEQVKLAEKEAAAARQGGSAERGSATGPDATAGSDGAAGSGTAGERDAATAPERAGLLDSVPVHFPALLQAQKISRAAAAAGFEWDTLSDVWDKVAEEKAELEAAYQAAPKSADGRVLAQDGERSPLVAAAEMEFGDLLFSLVNVARRMGIDAEGALRASNAKFRRRFALMERAAWEQGHAIEELSTEEMDAIWQQVKEDE